MVNFTDGFCPVFKDFNGEAVPTKMLNFTERAAAIFLYSMIIVLSIGGNSIVLFSIMYFNRLRRAPTNIFIANLAVADILMATFSVPFGYWDILVLQYWPFGSFLCPTIYFLQCLAVMLSSHTLILISIDRFGAIMLPFSYKLRHKDAMKALVIVWLIDTSISTPIAVVQRTTPLFNSSECSCTETWGSELGAYVYSQAALVLQYFFPILVFLTTYTGIGIKLWYSRLPSSDSQYQTRVCKQRRDNTMKKLIIMMLTLCLMYTFCWLPLNLLNIAATRCQSFTEYPYILYVWWGCHLVAMSHAFVNPIVYMFTNARFCEAFKFVLQKMCAPFGIQVSYNSNNLKDDAVLKYVFSNMHSQADDGYTSALPNNRISSASQKSIFSEKSPDSKSQLKKYSSCKRLSKSYETIHLTPIVYKPREAVSFNGE